MDCDFKLNGSVYEAMIASAIVTLPGLAETTAIRISKTLAYYSKNKESCMITTSCLNHVSVKNVLEGFII